MGHSCLYVIPYGPSLPYNQQVVDRFKHSFFVCGNTWICARDSQYICSWINIWLMIKNSLEIHIRGQYSSKQAIDWDILLRCFLQGWSNWHVLVVHKRLKSVTQSFLPRTRALESGHIIETKSRLNKPHVPLSVLPDTNLRCTSELSFHTKAQELRKDDDLRLVCGVY